MGADTTPGTGLDQRVAALEAEVATLQGQVSQLQQAIAQLPTRLPSRIMELERGAVHPGPQMRT